MKSYLLLLCSILFLLLSCSNEDKENAEVPYLRVPEISKTLQYTEEAQTANIGIETNSPDWSIASDKEWCEAKRISSNQQLFRLSVSKNEETEVREAKLTLKGAGVTETIVVKQLGTAPAILLNPTSLENVPSTVYEVKFQITTNVTDYEIVVPKKDQSWVSVRKADVPTRAMVTYGHLIRIENNPTIAPRTTTITVRATNEEHKPASTLSITQKKRTIDADDVPIEGDIQVKPTGGKDNQHHAGQDITRTFDGLMGANSTPFHSPWETDKPTTVFPVTLEYQFDGSKPIDYLIYHPRGGNGNFGQLKLYTASKVNDSYTLEGEFDFKESYTAQKITFKTPLTKPTKIKFEVSSGQGGFASCDEMEFFQRNTEHPINAQLLTVFTSTLCTELLPNTTDDQINALPGYFANLAMHLKNNTYDEWEKNFRIRSYEAYSNVEEWAERLMTSKYSNLDNPTGIYANAGDSIIVLVGDTHGHEISLQAIPGVEASGDSYFIEEGVNKIGIRNTGMLYVMYTAAPSEKPIQIHIPLGSGTVNGFFDLKEHQTDVKYAELLRKSTYKYFCARGEKIMFYFHRSKLLEFVPNNIRSAIDLWDNIISWQQELMGITDVRPSQVNNHLYAISLEEDYMWASDYRIAFLYTYLDNILLYDNVMAAADNAWGPAHEIGHIHQRAINWPGSSESSNNLFSNYVIYRLGKYCSRGTALSALATARYVKKQAWWNMGTSTHQNEDTEIHLRMNWQLWNYYHRCEYKPDFWQTLFKLLRNNRISESDPGAGQLLFAKMASQAANQDLTEFFDRWGFFEPANATIEQYGTWKYVVTDAMIAEAKSFMAKFPKPKHAFYYIEDRKKGDTGLGDTPVGDLGHYSQFQRNTQITKAISYTLSGRQVTVSNADEAVALEWKVGDKVIFFSNCTTFEVPASISLNNAVLYAVQADGKRISASVLSARGGSIRR